MSAFLLIAVAVNAFLLGILYDRWEQRAAARDTSDVPGLDDCHPDHHERGSHAPRVPRQRRAGEWS